jgi:hypothetical protein
MNHMTEELTHFANTLREEGYVFMAPTQSTEIDMEATLALTISQGENHNFARIDNPAHPHKGLVIGIANQSGIQSPLAVKEYISECYGFPLLTH